MKQLAAVAFVLAHILVSVTSNTVLASPLPSTGPIVVKYDDIEAYGEIRSEQGLFPTVSGNFLETDLVAAFSDSNGTEVSGMLKGNVMTGPDGMWFDMWKTAYAQPGSQFPLVDVIVESELRIPFCLTGTWGPKFILDALIDEQDFDSTVPGLVEIVCYDNGIPIPIWLSGHDTDSISVSTFETICLEYGTEYALIIRDTITASGLRGVSESAYFDIPRLHVVCPEPATYGMATMAALGFVGLIRRRRNLG